MRLQNFHEKEIKRKHFKNLLFAFEEFWHFFFETFAYVYLKLLVIEKFELKIAGGPLLVLYGIDILLKIIYYVCVCHNIVNNILWSVASYNIAII